MRRNLSLLLCALLVFSLGGCASTPERPLPILLYRDVVPDGSACGEDAVTAGRFREDMQWLKDHGFSFVLPRDLVAGDVPEKPVMVTFDDGLAGCYEVVFPILKEMDVKVALALIVSMPDTENGDYLSWEMCREMSDSGLVEFGSHTYDLHHYDPSIKSNEGGNGIQHRSDETPQEYASRLWRDLYKSIHILRDRLDAEVTFFVYPYGLMDMWSEGYVRSHFPISLSNGSGIASLDDFRDLKRLTVTMKAPVSSLLKALT